MRLARLLVLLLAVLVLAACTHAATRPVAVAPVSELDAIAYGPPPGMTQVRRVAATVPVNVMAPNEVAPYVLDTGDKLRIVVFGQDTLSNNYTVDAAGMVTMPLIGPVKARGLTTSQLTGAITTSSRRASSAIPAWPSRSRSTGRSSCSAKSPIRASTRSSPTRRSRTRSRSPAASRPAPSATHVRVRRRTADGEVVLKLPLNAPLRPGDTITVTERWF